MSEPGAVEVAEITARPEWDRLEDGWRALDRTSPAAAPPLSWEWTRAWWDVYAEAYRAELRILAARRDGRLVGLLPLYLRGSPLPEPLRYRRLGFLSTGEEEFEETCPDYMDMLAAPGEAAACARAMRAFLVGGAGAPWDRLELNDLRADSALLDAGRWPPGFRVDLAARGTCPSANLAGGFDAWLARLPPRRREQPRRMLREVDKSGARLEVAATAAEVEPFFEDLVRLHQARWNAVGKPGCFAAPRFTEFHRRLAHALVPQGRVVLARLRVEEQAIVALYGFRTGPRFDFYQGGLSPDSADTLKSPGVAAHVLLMRHLAVEGVTHYDFLRGSAAYKDRLATDESPLVLLTVRRDSVRSRMWDAAGFGGRAAGGVLRRIRSGLGGRKKPPAA